MKIGNLSVTNLLNVAGSVSMAITTITTSTTLGPTHYTVLANAVLSTITVTLPTAVGITGRIYNIKKIDITTNTVIIATTLSQLIDGSTTRAIYTPYETINVQSDGSNWHII